MTENLREPLLLLSDLANKVALELVYAEAGKDNGLLPINDLLGQMEALPGPLPSLITTSLATARASLDAVFQNGGQFDPTTLDSLSAWTRWVQSAVAAARAGQALPPIPEAPPIIPLPTNTTADPAATATPVAETDASPIPNLESDGDLLREFVQESREHLQDIELGLLALEEDPADAGTLNSIFRAFHTFKGGSGFLNLGPISKLAHELESLLDLARQRKLTVTSEITNVILVGRDTLNQFIDALEQQLNGQAPPAAIVVPMQALLQRIHTIAQTASQASLGTPALPTLPPEERAAIPLALDTCEKATVAPAAPVPLLSPAAESRPRGELSSVVKVDTQKLDGLVDLVGEMVIAQSMVAQGADSRLQHDQQLVRNLAQLGRITKELQRVAMSLRMVPIRATFQRMIRVVRDLAAKSSKEAELLMDGEDTEVDRTIAEEITDPLVHMIRNAVDHGIEKPEKRLQAGKPAHGQISLRAFHQGGNIVIELADDGAGLCKERILAKALAQGLVSPNESLSDNEIFNLIFMAGFSTAESVTDISGRGVGMDVVRRNIDKLRGKIDIQSEPGRGCKFTIYLPLTLAIIDGLLVGVGAQRFVLPTLSVRASFRPTPNMITTVCERGELVDVRGQLVPLVRLHQHFGITPQSSDPTQAIVVVVESNNIQRCLLVDQLLGKQEVVIKSLGEEIKQSPAVAGATILGDGRVGLILDASVLVKLESAFQKAA